MFIALSFLACTQDELTQSWQLDRTRILAAKAEPAEIRPGESVEFQSLVFSPENIESVVWFACLPESSTSFGCTVDPSVLESLDSETPDFAALSEAGFAGIEPFLAPSWSAPEDALEGLDTAQRQEGLSALVTLTAIPENANEDSDIEIAYKRFPISESPTPNHNPTIVEMRINDVAYAPEETFIAQADETYTIEPFMSEDSVETYSYQTREGTSEDRTEEPYFSWYTEGGSFNQPFSLHPYNSVEWTAPPTPFSGRIITVLRDRRGGIAWSWVRVEVQP